jgi:hypothetical protein
MTPSQQHQHAMAWAIDILKTETFDLQGMFKPVRLMPWSSVYHAETSAGIVFLKIVTPPFDVEINLLPYLSEQFPTAIPAVIACSQTLQCMLMHDAGAPLRLVLQKKYQLHLAKQALNTYAKIQQSTCAHIDRLLTLGVPDWRLHTLPSHYLALLEKTVFLTHDGLSLSEISQLKAQYAKVQTLCEALIQYNIPETIEHGDFHDNNILINKDKQLIIHDWGDSVISHPFFSLCSFLYSASNHHQPALSPDIKKSLEATYFKHWSNVLKQKDYQHITALLKPLNFIKFSLSFSRIAACPGMHDLGDYKGTIASALKAFLKYSATH